MTSQGPGSAGHWGVLSASPMKEGRNANIAFRPGMETLGLDGDPWAGRRPLDWTETLGLEGDPWAGRRPLGWKETLGLNGDPWAVQAGLGKSSSAWQS